MQLPHKTQILFTLWHNFVRIICIITETWSSSPLPPSFFHKNWSLHNLSVNSPLNNKAGPLGFLHFNNPVLFRIAGITFQNFLDHRLFASLLWFLLSASHFLFYHSFLQLSSTTDLSYTYLNLLPWDMKGRKENTGEKKGEKRRKQRLKCTKFHNILIFFFIISVYSSVSCAKQKTQTTAVCVGDAEKTIRGEVGRNKIRMNVIS